mmetsp:Transcript_34516/g.102537  ORF Transcript_34516/g.102537 Transcript_34516/m.102537 type:complete len:206 (-) Transcript_34516:279-896(-)
MQAKPAHPAPRADQRHHAVDVAGKDVHAKVSRSSEVGVERPHVIPHVVELILNFVAAVSPAPRQLHGLVGVQRPLHLRQVKVRLDFVIHTRVVRRPVFSDAATEPQPLGPASSAFALVRPPTRAARNGNPATAGAASRMRRKHRREACASAHIRDAHTCVQHRRARRRAHERHGLGTRSRRHAHVHVQVVDVHWADLTVHPLKCI